MKEDERNIEKYQLAGHTTGKLSFRLPTITHSTKELLNCLKWAVLIRSGEAEGRMQNRSHLVL